MVIGDYCMRFFIDQPRGLRPGGSLPIVLAFFQGNPGRQRLAQMIGQRIDVGFIHFAQRVELAVGFFSVMEFHAVLGKDVADLAQILRGQPVVWQRLGRRAEYLRKVNDGVARNRECKFRLFFTRALDADDGESASVQYRR